MRKIYLVALVLLVSLIGFKVEASHMAGFRITYECIAPEQYRVSMIVFRDCSGVGFGNRTVQIGFYNNCVSDGDCPDGTFTAYRTPGTGLPVDDECVDLPPTTCFGGNRFGLESYEFEGIFEVPRATPDSCQDWWFYWSQATCCRNPSATLAATGTPYVSAYLNNSSVVNPCNNSSISDLPYVPAFCPNDPVCLVTNFFDPDGDSLAFHWARAAAYGGFGGRVCEGDSIAYRAPYQPHAPGASSTPWVLDPKTGTICWTPSQVETVVIVTRVEEWRGNVLTGWTWLDLQVRVEQDPIICTQSKIPTYDLDTLFLSCGDTILEFDLTTNVHCSTVSPDASEWRLFSKETGQAVSIDSCWILNCNVLTNVSPEFRIEIYEPLISNGIYYLYPKKGIDGNTFGNQCSKGMNEYDTLIIKVENCYEYNKPPELTNVSVEPIGNEDFIVSWRKADSMDFQFFRNYILYRTPDPNNSPWVEAIRFTDPNTTVYLDADPPRLPTETSMHYALAVEYDVVQIPQFPYTRMTPRSNVIGSIHLTNFPGESDPEAVNFDLRWNRYLGWNSALYNVEYTELNPKEWRFDGFTTNTTYTMTKPTGFGRYLIRNFTDNINQHGDSLRAYSNWIPMIVPKRELQIPNVITPNNDGKNDFFNVKYIEFYEGSEVIVYNRWGNEVFRNSNYTNDPDNSFGPGVKTGVYYYVILAPDDDEESGFQEHRGVIKVVN